MLKRIFEDDYFRHSKNYLIAELFNKGIVFITIPVFTYLLSPEDYGTLSIYTTLVSISIILLGLNMHTSVQRRFHETDNDFREFLGTNVLFLVSFNIIFIIILYLIKNEIASFLSISNDIFIYAVISGFLGVFLQIELSFLQTSQQSQKYAFILVAKNTLLTFGAILWIYTLEKNRYLGRIYSELFVMTFMFLIVIRDLLKNYNFRFKIKHIQYSLNYGLPLALGSMSGLIMLFSDRIIINQLLGSHETGLYSFAFNVGMIMNVIVTSFSNAWLPIFYKFMNNEDYNSIQNSATNYSKIIFLLTLILVLFNKEIVMIMANEKYYSALIIVPIIVLSFSVVYIYILFSNYALYRKKTGLIALFTSIAAVVNIAINYRFIPEYGYIVAAWSTLISYLLLLILHYLNAKFILKERTIQISNILINFLLLISIIILYSYLDLSNYFPQIVFKLTCIIFLSIIYYKSKMLTLCGFLKN